MILYLICIIHSAIQSHGKGNIQCKFLDEQLQSIRIKRKGIKKTKKKQSNRKIKQKIKNKMVQIKQDNNNMVEETIGAYPQLANSTKQE